MDTLNVFLAHSEFYYTNKTDRGPEFSKFIRFLIFFLQILTSLLLPLDFSFYYRQAH